MDYIIEYLKINKSIEDFKKISFFSSFQSWTGSEIPLINRQIDTLKNVLSKIPQEGYLEHKYYISTEIDKMERYKEIVEIQEYLMAAT